MITLASLAVVYTTLAAPALQAGADAVHSLRGLGSSSPPALPVSTANGATATAESEEGLALSKARSNAMAIATWVSSGDPIAATMARSSDATVVCEGVTLRVLLQKGERQIVEREVVIGECAHGLVEQGGLIYLALGTAGAAVLMPDDQLQPLALRPGYVCTDAFIERSTPSGVVGFLFSRSGNGDQPGEHRVELFDAETLAPSGVYVGQSERAYALAIDADSVFVAAGAQGVIRHSRAASPTSVTVIGGPEETYARGLALAGGRLWVAAGRPGVLEVDLSAPWTAVANPSSWFCHDIARGRPMAKLRRRYVVRVAATDDGTRVVCGTQGLPAELGDGAPYGQLGPFGIDLTPGGINPVQFRPSPKNDWIVVLDVTVRPGNGMSQATVPSGAFRSLDIRADSIMSQRLVQGLQIGPIKGRTVRLGKAHRASGLSPIDGVAVDASRVVLGRDGLGGLQGSGLELVTGGAQEWAGHPQPAHYGQAFDAAWSSGADKWAVTGGWFQPSLLHVNTLERVQLPGPRDQAGRRGHTYFHTVDFGPYVVVSRVATNEGLLVYRKINLEDRGKGVNRGPVLPIQIADTRANPKSDDPGSVPNVWRTRALPLGPDLLEPESWLLVSAAGHVPEREDAPMRPRLLIHTLTDGSLTRTGDAFGQATQATMVSVCAFELRGKRWALGTSLGGAIDLFDVTNPSSPTLVASTSAATAAWDGSHHALIDCEVCTPKDMGPQVLIAAGRAGILRIDLERAIPAADAHQASIDLTPDEVLDTPGWCTGIVLLDKAGPLTQVIACCQKAGAALVEIGPR